MTSEPRSDDGLSLNTIGENPYVGETPTDALDSWLTPNPLFYVRSQFNYPAINDEEWSLNILNSTDSKTFNLYDIKNLPKTTMSNCEDLWERVLTIPCSTSLKNVEQEKVITAIHKILEGKAGDV